jgi:simple sugar transport system substrate-binding protein
MTDDERRGLSRKRFLAAAGASGAGAMFLDTLMNVAPQVEAEGLAAPGAMPAASPWANWVKSFYGKPVKFGVSIFETANPYFNPSRAAASDVAGQLGITVNWVGPPAPDTPGQISQFRAMVRSGYQAIVVIPAAAAPWVQPIREARAKGVLVCCANQDSPGSSRELFFGQDLFGAAVQQAHIVAQAAGGKKGTVALTNCAPGSDALNKREAGYYAGFKQVGWSIVGQFTTTPTDPAKLHAQITDIVRAHPNLTAINCGCGPDTAEAGKVKTQMHGNFIVVGTDLLFDTLNGINNGTIHATVGQNPYMQVWLPLIYSFARVVLDLPQLHLPGRNWFTGNEVVTRANVNRFIKRERRFA